MTIDERAKEIDKKIDNIFALITQYGAEIHDIWVRTQQKVSQDLDKSLNKSEDCISRQAVFDFLNNAERKVNDTWYSFYQETLTYIDELPSVEPCEVSQGLVKDSQGFSQGEDCISRQDALKELCDDCAVKVCSSKCEEYHWLVSLPSVEPARKKGTWIITYPFGQNNPIYSCSECRASNNSVFKNFCPNCGADMREATSE